MTSLSERHKLAVLDNSLNMTRDTELQLTTTIYSTTKELKFARYAQLHTHSDLRATQTEETALLQAKLSPQNIREYFQ